jgi:hypothetical protein
MLKSYDGGGCGLAGLGEVMSNPLNALADPSDGVLDTGVSNTLTLDAGALDVVPQPGPIIGFGATFCIVT